MVYKRISIEHRIIIDALKEEGKSLRKIRNIMLIRHGINVTIQGIRKIILKFQKTSNYEDHKQVGRPPNFSLRSKRIIRRICLKNGRLLLKNITGSYNAMSKDRMSKITVNRILLKYGLRSHRTVNKYFLIDMQ